MVITFLPRGTADRGRSALPKTATQRETGNRMIDWGVHFQVSGLGRQVPGSGVQVQAQVRETRHPSSVIDSVLFPGGRHHPFSPHFSPQRSPPFSPPSSIQSSRRFGWQVSAPGGGWQEFRPQPSVICHRLRHLPISGVGWQPQVAGGSPDPFSPPFSPQRSPQFSPPMLPLPSVLRHRFSHLPCGRPPPFSPPWSTKAN